MKQSRIDKLSIQVAVEQQYQFFMSVPTTVDCIFTYLRCSILYPEYNVYNFIIVMIDDDKWTPYIRSKLNTCNLTKWKVTSQCHDTI